jgi:cytochrome c551/c552
MIINGFLLKNPLRVKGFLVIGLLSLFLSSPFSSHSQSAEAEKNFAVCKACHNIDGPKLIGPNLKGITERREEAWLIKFIQNSQAMIDAGDPIAVQVWEENNKIPMPPNPQLNEEQVKDLLLYIEAGGVVPGAEPVAEEEAVDEHAVSHDEATEEFLAEMKSEDYRHMQATFIAMVVLILISLFDLFVTRFVTQKWILYVIILISLVVGAEVVFVEATNLGRQQYYQPDQPIWFSHKIHAGQNQIDCQYCHFTADKSMHAGIPPVQVCLNCHNQVREGQITGTEEIDKIHAAWNEGKPIEWIKVHNLPDHAYFNHAQHVTVGKVECNECHGPVEKMDQVMQVHDLGMGWCIECHRDREIQVDNKFYEQYTELQEALSSGDLKRATVMEIGGDECQKCHY